MEPQPFSDAVLDIIREHIAYGDAHYPAESNHHLTPDRYGDGASLWSARSGGRILGVAALKPLSGAHVEVKTMFVRPKARGRRVGAALLTSLLAEARRGGFARASLETGSRDASAAARRLYESFGFRFCTPFEPYVEDPESVFMTLTL